ncbi:efflux RND transporter periplasmic adaptor subunit [Paenibacillus doosanensis]|uniref:Multidrug resistance protein MdtN n=1 Tax=Paenibacillus konkukensis TaxID=2020716 RepID=A0ABY4RKN6_9BACL|nr:MULTISPECIES: efflux RND transporter periplasmic adaptor subunit [Paenibacillus]MCS7460055.1 efflux RND transporter periplasmic adaptor subunit [Paenibacillus doosanensis]UQZ82710.1 Multidrug resistance protein MdtN [Paenibacillus konkukensis]
MRKKQTAWLRAILSLAVVFALPGCGVADNTAGAAQVISVQAVKLGQSVDYGLSGKIIPDQENKIVAKTSGKVAEVKVDEGAVVKKGDLLIQLETDDLISQAKQAEAGLVASKAKLADTQAGARSQEIAGLESAVQSAEASLNQVNAAVEQAKSGVDLAQKTYNRLRNKYDSTSTVTKEDMDKGTYEYEKAKAAYDQSSAQQKAAEAQVAAARSKLDLAKSGATANTIEALQADVERLAASLELSNHVLADASVISPIDGIVSQRNIQPGEMAQAGTMLLTIVKMDPVQVELSVPEAQIGKMKAGSDVEVRVLHLPDKTFAGKISFVSPVSNENSTTFPVKVTIGNPDGLLLAGMLAEVYLKDYAQNGLEVPKSALIQKDNKTFVFTIQDGTAKLIEVATTDKSADWVYVMDNPNLKGSVQIVLNPSEQLLDGSKVTIE